jgi:glycosyltransferase involved in cell wall biosynthesis
MAQPLRVALVTLGDPGRLTGGYLYHRRMAQLAPSFDAVVDFVSFPDRPFPLAVADARMVVAQIARSSAQVILLDSIAAAFLGPWLAANEPPMPVVGMLHQPPGGIDFGPPRSTLQAVLDRLAWRRARRLLVASDALAAELLDAGEPAERVLVIPPGRDVAVELGRPPGDLRLGRTAAFLCVGNWVERKGILSLLDAFALLPPSAATLHLVGDEGAEPHYGERVRRRLSRPDLAGRVVCHGPLSVSDVAALYAAADAFVLPSLKEPYGTVIGEAMAFGLPVVGWNAGNLPYLAEDGREGLIVQPSDTRALAAAMLRLAEDEPLRRRMGAAARERASSRPTWEDSARMLFAALREVIAPRS